MRNRPFLTTASALMFALSFLPAARADAAISGIVMSSEGAAVAGARVSIQRQELPIDHRARLLSSSPEAVPISSTKSDAKGAFSIESPDEPIVQLLVFAPGYRPKALLVEPDEDLGAIALQKAEARKGTVTAGGKPVAGATVVIGYFGAEYLTRTDEQGRYEAPDARGAAITVIHPDFVIDEPHDLSLSALRNANLDRALTAGNPLVGIVLDTNGRTPVEGAAILLDGWPVVKSGEDGRFVIPHAPAKWETLSARKGELGGDRVFSKASPHSLRLAPLVATSGRVIDSKSKLPLAGATVRLARTAIGMNSSDQVAFTDAKGTFSLVSPEPPANLVVTRAGYATNVAPSSTKRGGNEIRLDPLARISGTVIDEENRPVAVASVQSEDAQSGGMTMRRMRRDGGVVTGPDGRFTIQVAADAELRLRASKKGLPSEQSPALRLEHGERKRGITIVLPSGVLVSGRVVDRDGNGIRNVSVVPSESDVANRNRVIISNLLREEQDTVRSTADGTFSLRVKEGLWDFAFRGDGWAPAAVRAQKISTGASATVNVKLEPSVEISGRVVRSGAGVEGVSIFVPGDQNATASTLSDGSFTLSGLAAGPVRVIVNKREEFIELTRNLEAPSRDVLIEVPAGGTIRGRVVEKGSGNAITSFQAGISTSRSGGGMVRMAMPSLQSFTSDDGTFTLEHVPPGSASVVATAPGHAAGRASVSVEDGKTIADVVVELDTGVTLRGRVTGPDGAPLGDAVVRISMSPTSGVSLAGAEQRAVTDADGEYELTGLSPGDENVDFTHPKYLSQRKPISLSGSEKRLDVQLSAGVVVRGTVVTDSGAPVADADVQAYGAGAEARRVRTDVNGAFTMESMSPARYRFIATKAPFAPGSVDDFDVTGGSPVRISLKQGATIYGRVTGLSASELANATVDARSPGGSVSGPVDPTGSYRLEGVPTGSVTVSATIMSRGFGGRRSSGTQTIDLADGSSRQLDLEFRTDVTITGIVRRNGQPLRGGTIMFSSRSSGSATGPIDEQGRYSITGIDDGDYDVTTVDMNTFSPFSTKYTVRGSSTFDIDFTTSSLRGRVIDAMTGDPLAGASIEIRPGSVEGQPQMARRQITADDGVFVVDYLAPGTYVVNAIRDGYGNQLRELTIGNSAPPEVELKMMRNDGVLVTVVDARDRRPLGAAAVVFDAAGRVVSQDRNFMASSDPGAGLKLPLAAGSYTATIWASGYAPQSVRVSAPSTIAVGLTPGGTIALRSRQSNRMRVRLIDSSGSPYPRFDFRPSTFELLPAPAVTTLPRIAPGTYQLQLLAENDAIVTSTQVTVNEGQVSDASI